LTPSFGLRRIHYPKKSGCDRPGRLPPDGFLSRSVVVRKEVPELRFLGEWCRAAE
jgi:hypothetical protein